MKNILRTFIHFNFHPFYCEDIHLLDFKIVPSLNVIL